MKKLPRAFYDRDAAAVAQDLLGMFLVRIENGVKRIGKIVETEAYLGPHDLAAHSARGKTKRNAVMFGPPGHAYVYRIYGIYDCMNVVTEAKRKASAVLLRALEPVANIEGKTSGPGLLCRAMGIDRRLNGHDLLSKEFFIAESPFVLRQAQNDIAQGDTSFIIVKRPRIGVDYAGRWAKRLLRFYIKGNPHVSRP